MAFELAIPRGLAAGIGAGRAEQIYLKSGVSRFFYEPMIQLSGILDYRDFFLSDKIVLISTLLAVG